MSESGDMSAVGCGGGSKRRREGEMIHSMYVHARILGDNLHFHSLDKLDKLEKVKANAKRKAGGEMWERVHVCCMYVCMYV